MIREKKSLEKWIVEIIWEIIFWVCVATIVLLTIRLGEWMFLRKIPMSASYFMAYSKILPLPQVPLLLDFLAPPFAGAIATGCSILIYKTTNAPRYKGRHEFVLTFGACACSITLCSIAMVAVIFVGKGILAIMIILAIGAITILLGLLGDIAIVSVSKWFGEMKEKFIHHFAQKEER